MSSNQGGSSARMIGREMAAAEDAASEKNEITVILTGNFETTFWILIFFFSFER